MDKCCPSVQPDSDRLIGTWKIVSIVSDIFDPDGQKTSHPADWYGFITLTAQHRAIVIQTATDRPIPETDEEYIYSFRSMIAYSGTYRIDDDKLIVDVDISWDQRWVGADVIFGYRFELGRLILEDEPKGYSETPGQLIQIRWTCQRDCRSVH